MAANNPKHGDAIIRQSPDPLGGTKLIATQQFQRFLDELGDAANAGVTNSFINLVAQIGRLQAVIHKQDKELESLRQEFHGS